MKLVFGKKRAVREAYKISRSSKKPVHLRRFGRGIYKLSRGGK